MYAHARPIDARLTAHTSMIGCEVTARLSFFVALLDVWLLC